MSWRRFFRRPQRDAEAARDLAFYLESEIQDNLARGMPPGDARAAARRKLGNPAIIREEIYAMNSLVFVDSLRQDAVLAFRGMRRNAAFTTTAVLALALGIGANAAIFSVFYDVLLRPLPYRDSAQLLSLGRSVRGLPGGLAAEQEFTAWHAENRVLESIAAWNTGEFNLTGSGTPERVVGADVTADFLSVLGIQPALGRALTQADDRPGAPAAVWLTREIWQRRFGGDPSIVGRTLVMNGDPSIIAGVLPARFQFPGAFQVELLVPARLPAQPVWDGPRLRVVNVIARPRPGVTVPRVLADLSAISARYQPQMPWFYASPTRPSRVTAVSLQEQLVGGSRAALRALLWSVAVLLLLASVNVANLQLARAGLRRRELGLRAALGAGRVRLAQWMAVENLALGGIAGLVAVAVAYTLLAILKASRGVRLPDPRAFDPGWMLWCITLGLSLAAGLLAGLLPAVTATKISLNEVLKSGARAALGGRRSPARAALVLIQVALALVLLLGSGLLLRSLQRVLAVDWGFRPERLLTMRMTLPEPRHDNARQAAFVETLLARVAVLPGVDSAATANSLPLGGLIGTASIRFEGQPVPPPHQMPAVPVLVVSPGYFHTMRTPLFTGRHFAASDRANTEPVAIVNATFAKRFYPAGDAIGRRIQWSANQWYTTIVGVASDIRQSGREAPAEAQLFVPEAQNPARMVNLIVRARTDAAALTSAVQAAVWAVDKDQPIFDVATMDERIRLSGANRAVETWLIASFGLLALALAAIGIYGVVSESVNQRTGEIGLRVALGARAQDVLRMVLGRSLALTLGGIAAGAAAGWYLVRYLQSLLFGIQPRDAVAFAAAAILLLAVALAAGYLPARRAARIDPVDALRCE